MDRNLQLMTVFDATEYSVLSVATVVTRSVVSQGCPKTSTRRKNIKKNPNHGVTG